MNTESARYLQVGDRVRLCDSSSVAGSGTITGMLPGGYARVRWLDLGFPTTHALHALELAPAPDNAGKLLESLADLGRDLDGE